MALGHRREEKACSRHSETTGGGPGESSLPPCESTADCTTGEGTTSEGEQMRRTRMRKRRRAVQRFRCRQPPRRHGGNTETGRSETSTAHPGSGGNCCRSGQEGGQCGTGSQCGSGEGKVGNMSGSGVPKGQDQGSQVHESQRQQYRTHFRNQRRRERKGGRSGTRHGALGCWSFLAKYFANTRPRQVAAPTLPRTLRPAKLVGGRMYENNGQKQRQL